VPVDELVDARMLRILADRVERLEKEGWTLHFDKTRKSGGKLCLIYSWHKEFSPKDPDDTVMQALRRERIMATAIDSLDFSTRTYNCLVDAKIKTVRELVARINETEGKLPLKNFGRTSAEEVNRYFEELGWPERVHRRR
jgi:DNA-directed RNA polymerase alpha subunit